MSARRSRRKAKAETGRGWIVVAAGGAVLLAVVLVTIGVARWATRHGPQRVAAIAPQNTVSASLPLGAADAPEPTPSAALDVVADAAATKRDKPALGPALIALVIDDMGRDPRMVAKLDRLGIPLALAVLPFESRTREVVAAIRDTRHELLLHLPMEAVGTANPGPGAINRSMPEHEVKELVIRALEAVPGAVGVNNHMGSALTADEQAMRFVFSVLAERGLYFLDSRTSAQSVAYALAREVGLPAAQRAVFLDSDIEEQQVEVQFDRLLSVASERGVAVAIAHPHAATMRVLEERIPEALAARFEFVPLSYLLERSSAEVE